jgi:P4 family phage/plasmid primase-like protien
MDSILQNNPVVNSPDPALARFDRRQAAREEQRLRELPFADLQDETNYYQTQLASLRLEAEAGDDVGWLVALWQDHIDALMKELHRRHSRDLVPHGDGASSIDRDFIIRVKSETSIVDLVQRAGVILEGDGRMMHGCCRWHDDHDPSFVIWPGKGRWYCYGACKTGGDAIDFVRWTENLGFMSALRRLADLAGLPWPERKRAAGVGQVGPVVMSVAGMAPSPVIALTDDFHPTDLGNAERLVKRHGTELRYCHPWNRWLAWDGRRWAIDDTGEITRRAKETVRQIYRQAADTEDDGARKALVNHARRSEAEARIRAMLSLAESEPGIPVLPAELDRDKWLLTVLNGTLDLRTGELQPHQAGNMITRLAPVEYDPVATCPTWEAFLDRIMGSNANLIAYLQRAVGYSLTADVREQVLFILYGTGQNGKSTFLETLLALLGDYGQQTPTDTLLIKRDNGIPNDVARLKGARLVTAIEAEEGKRLAESLVKQMTGGDRLVARFLHREFFEFKPAFKLWLATNHKPQIRGTDRAIWRRIRLIPFSVTIPDADVDLAMPDKLQAELPGILAWAMVGCLAWQSGGLGEPGEVLEATAEYRQESDLIGRFLDESCVTGPTFKTRAGELYEAYKTWAKANGEGEVSGTAFGLAMTERGFARDKDRRGWFYCNVGLIDNRVEREDNQD